MPRLCYCGRVSGPQFNSNRDCVKCWLWTYNEAYRLSHGGPKEPPKSEPHPDAHSGQNIWLGFPEIKRPTCVHLGAPDTKQREAVPGYDWRKCELKMADSVCPCQACKFCPRYEPDGDYEHGSFGVVLGCYGLPRLAELQVRLIRDMHGSSIPICIADDGSGMDAEFLRIESNYPNVLFWPNDERLGHYAGDLSVFAKGLQWAKREGLRMLCKLSQRFLWTRKNWLAEIAEEMDARDHETCMQRCLDAADGVPVDLFVRSECMMLKVKDWFPLLHEFNYQELGNPTELRIWHIIHQHFGERFLEWKRMPVNRYLPAEETVWHSTHSPGDYNVVAGKYGITLDSHFTVAGWERVEGWKRG